MHCIRNHLSYSSVVVKILLNYTISENDDFSANNNFFRRNDIVLDIVLVFLEKPGNHKQHSILSHQT